MSFEIKKNVKLTPLALAVMRLALLVLKINVAKEASFGEVA